MKIYFAGSIRGGRNDRVIYEQIINYLQSFGEVLTEHIGLEDLNTLGENDLADQEIYSRDMAWLSMADIVVADVTTPSLGVGFEIGSAIALNKKVLCFYKAGSDKKLSAMISGCPALQVNEYHTFEDVKQMIDQFISRQSRTPTL